MPERPHDPAPSEQIRRVERGRVRALGWAASLLLALGLAHVGWANDTIERVIAALFGLVSLTGLVLIGLGHARASCWALIVALVGASTSVSAANGLAAQGPELVMLGLAPVLAGSMLERRDLWIATTGSAIALLTGTIVDFTSSTMPTDAGLRSATAAVGLGLIAVVLEFVSMRQRRALSQATLDNAALERAQDRQVADEQERTNLERAVAQAQRLESLGRLAGSVAHDFNNMLAGIRGNIEVASLVDDREAIREQLDTANLLIDRAAILTRNLLRFAKGQPVDAVIVDINELVRSSEPIYRSLVGAQIKLRVELGATRSKVPFNPAQFEQLLLNLVVNASDAMPHGGELCIGTWDLDDGRVELFVSDTGQGMSESIQVMIFQPFFTTKGKGTGIGLATVHDIVEAAGGEIRVDSDVGQGTRFCVLLPGVQEV